MTVQSNITSPWALRIRNGNEHYKKWEQKYRCGTLERYYEGFQWSLANGVPIEITGIRRPYTVNLVYTTIKRKIANITYTYPEFLLTPRPGQMDWNQDMAARSCQIKQDALNTIISNPHLEFVDDIRLAALDGFFRFSVMEVGYSKNWQNPNKPKMELKSHEDPNIPDSKDKVISDDAPLESETIYTKWISAKRFRVSMADDSKLRNCDWCGYFAYLPKKVLKETEGIDFPDNYDATHYSVDFADASSYFKDNKLDGSMVGDLIDRGELCKVWHIWDNISKQRLLLLDGNFHELYSEDFERLPFATYRSDISLKTWYPIPPVWQWLSPQNEVNETREQMRRYRRRTSRKFEVSKGDHDSDELEKLKSDEDGSIIVTKRKDGMPSVRPIINPEIGINITEGLITAKDDFDIVSANPVARGRASDRQTATATKQIANDQSIIESLEQIDFSRFVASIGREVLLQMGEKMDQGLWIKLTIDPGDQASVVSEVQYNAPVYKYITSQNLMDGYDFDVICNVKNSTPDQMQAELQNYTTFMSLMIQFPQIAMSPVLVRETAYRCGYKNEKAIAEFQKQALLMQMEKANMANQSLMASVIPPNRGLQNGGQSGLQQQMQPNSSQDITSQLTNQVG